MNKIFLGRCEEHILTIQDKSVDCIIIDPPYGTTPLDWDKLLDISFLWKELKRIRKSTTPILIFGQEPFSSYIRLSNIDEFKYDWYWQKERLTNVFQVKRRPGKVIETISVFYNEQCCYNPQKTAFLGKKVTNKVGGDFSETLAGKKSKLKPFSETLAGKKSKLKPIDYKDDGTRYPIQLLKINREVTTKNTHPTQKPLDLLEYLIKTYSNVNDVIFDPTFGSGTTLIAAKRLDRQYLGIEANEDYFNMADSSLRQILV